MQSKADRRQLLAVRLLHFTERMNSSSFPILLIVLLSLGASLPAQSRRVVPSTAKPAATAALDAGADRSARELFEEANTYNKVKFAEFERKRVPVSAALIQQTQRERKQLAAKYAGILEARTDLQPDDLYYLGLLHWIADNLDRARDAFIRYIPLAGTDPDRTQDARAIVSVIHARQRSFPEAVSMLAEYKKNSPVRPSQRAQIERELSRSFAAEGDQTSAIRHGEEAYSSYKTIAADPTARDKVLDEVIDCGIFLFNTYRRLGKMTETDATLLDMKRTAVTLQSVLLWYYSVDNQIKYQIETARKPLALESFASATAEIAKDFVSKEVQADLHQRLKKREKHYRLLGEAAPELQLIDQYFPGERKTLADLRGKVVLLDFWATWCGPCLDAFPAMREWQQDFGPSGFVILGITRYYGNAEGFPVDHPNEIDFLRRFRAAQGLTYDFLVAKDETNHKAFGATAIPTAAILDRNGVIRYLETGTNVSKLEEMRETIARLVAEGPTK